MKIPLSMLMEFVRTGIYFALLAYLALIAYKLGEYNTRLQELNTAINNRILTSPCTVNDAELAVKYLKDHNVLLDESKLIIPIPDEVK